MGNPAPVARVKIVSGGQTGVDRAALDFAIQHGFEHGGWRPRGRLGEDGVIPAIYRLRETNSAAGCVNHTGERQLVINSTKRRFRHIETGAQGVGS